MGVSASRRVMVVDDDPVVLEVTRERLASAGYAVSVRSSAFGTSAAIIRERPDIVLLDVSMPGIAGNVLADLVRERTEHPVSIILYSSGDRANLEDLARRCGACGVIQKTPSAASFFAQLDSCLARTPAAK